MKSENIKKIIEILQDEVSGRTKDALEKTHKDYKMTWVYKSTKGELFPHSTMQSGEDSLEDIYHIKGRVYEIMNVVESDNIVMVEMIESYPDPKTQEVYRTPLVIVLELEDGKIIRGRHYCDPNISYMHLTKEETDAVYNNMEPKIRIDESTADKH